MIKDLSKAKKILAFDKSLIIPPPPSLSNSLSSTTTVIGVGFSDDLIDELAQH